MLVITGEGLKTLDAVRGSFETTRSGRHQRFGAAFELGVRHAVGA